jgi:hypothetical protein
LSPWKNHGSPCATNGTAKSVADPERERGDQLSPASKGYSTTAVSGPSPPHPGKLPRGPDPPAVREAGGPSTVPRVAAGRVGLGGIRRGRRGERALLSPSARVARWQGASPCEVNAWRHAGCVSQPT